MRTPNNKRPLKTIKNNKVMKKAISFFFQFGMATAIMFMLLKHTQLSTTAIFFIYTALIAVIYALTDKEAIEIIS